MHKTEDSASEPGPANNIRSARELSVFHIPVPALPPGAIDIPVSHFDCAAGRQ